LGKIDVDLGHQIVILNDFQGDTLKDALLEMDPSRQLTVEEIIEIVTRWFKLLQKIHNLGYNYNDIEPDNIFIFEQTEIDDSKLEKVRMQKIIQKNLDVFIRGSHSGCKSYRLKKPSFCPSKSCLLQDLVKRKFEVSATKS
jgi:tRNA A-37 threonylcarbamoyl transferase component Bud32